jgi:class 3 adenylate cyclase
VQPDDGFEESPAWLEGGSAGSVPIRGTCSVGRLASNQVVLPDHRVSRRHVLINEQGKKEFWLVDLGSGNGTYLNGRRVVQPTRLRDGDRIEIATFQLVFHQPSARHGPAGVVTETIVSDQTIQELKSADCWLLVADIENSTQLIKSLSAADLSRLTGQWLGACRRLVEAHGGSINKFLGDGFFAYWPYAAANADQVARVMEALIKLQEAHNPAFRVVLHFGQVLMGGIASMGEESLEGREVHFVFRMEKLAPLLGQTCLISDSARLHLPPRLPLIEAGCHAVPGFDHEYRFHTVSS